MRVNSGLAVPLGEVEIRTSRSSGPGGQHANVTASRVEAVFDIGASSALTDEQRSRLAKRHGARVTATAQDSRSQAHNRELALERLREKLAGSLTVPRARRRTRPGRAAREKRLEAKRRTAQRKRGRKPPRPDE
jgi:ribosome-associated protein